MAWFKKKNKPLEVPADKDRKVKTEGLFIKCEYCGKVIWKKDLDDSLWVCEKCGYHFRINARERLSYILDEGKFKEFNSSLKSSDPLDFNDRKAYKGRLIAARRLEAGHCSETFGPVQSIGFAVAGYTAVTDLATRLFMTWLHDCL